MRLVILIISLFLTFAVSASELPKSNQFLVSGIEISEIDESAELARIKGIDKAQKQAFRLLLKRIYNIDLEKDTDLSNIENLVSSIELDDETITGKTYSATVNVQFNEDFTQFYINNNYLDKDAKAPEILIIPVYDENGFIKLWQRGNNWLNVWNNIPKEKLLNIRVPIGDFNDITKFRSSLLESITPEAAQELAAEYGVDKIIITQIFQRYSALSDNVDFSVILYELGDYENNTLIEHKRIMSGDDTQAVMEEFADSIIDSFNAAWVHYANQQNDSKRIQEFLVLISDISDWQRIQKLLSKPEFIEDYELLSISSKYAHISVKFNVEILKGIEDLKDYDLDILQGREGLLIIKQN